MKNYYAILEVPVGCGLAEIRQAYRRLVQENLDNAAFAELNEAHEVLTTPARRADYDRAVWGETFAEGGGAASAAGEAETATLLPVVFDPAAALGGAGRCPMGAEAQCPVLLGRVGDTDTYCPECGFLLAGLNTAAGFAPAGAAATEEGLRLEESNGRVHRLQPGLNMVGRESADVLLPDKTVSRQHARLEVGGDGVLTLEDLSSTNGTQVGSDALVPHIPRTLQAGDRVRFGSVLVVLHLPVDALGRVPPAPTTVDGGAGLYSSTPPELGAGGPPARAQVVETREEGGRTYLLPPGVTTFGRRAENSVVLLGDPYVSGSHAQIVADGDLFQLIDVGSTNGTLHNGERLAVHAPVTLMPDDVILIGGTALRFERRNAEDIPEETTEETTEEITEEAVTEEAGAAPALVPVGLLEDDAPEEALQDGGPEHVGPEQDGVLEHAPAQPSRTPEGESPDFPMQDSPTNVER